MMCQVHRRQRAAGHVVGRRVVIVSKPDRADEIARIAIEPGVLEAVRRAGFSGDVDIIELGALRHVPSCTTLRIIVTMSMILSLSKTCRRRGIVTLIAVNKIAVAVVDFDRCMRGYMLAAVGEGGVGAGHFDHVHIVGTDRE